MENSQQILKTLSIEVPHDLATHLLDIYPREVKTYVHTETRRGMIAATLFLTGKKRGQLECPDTLQSIHVTENCSEKEVMKHGHAQKRGWTLKLRCRAKKPVTEDRTL